MPPELATRHLRFSCRIGVGGPKRGGGAAEEQAGASQAEALEKFTTFVGGLRHAVTIADSWL